MKFYSVFILSMVILSLIARIIKNEDKDNIAVNLICIIIYIPILIYVLLK